MERKHQIQVTIGNAVNWTQCGLLIILEKCSMSSTSGLQKRRVSKILRTYYCVRYIAARWVNLLRFSENYFVVDMQFWITSSAHADVEFKIELPFFLSEAKQVRQDHEINFSKW